MAKRAGTIPKAPVGRILEEAGAKRVSADAVDALTEILSAKALDIATRALAIAKHSGRKTIHDGDIKMALK